jgi:exosortase/archaeosortase family protein
MSTILTGMAVAFALFATNRTWWERGIVILSAIPIAIIVNVARITLTGLAFTLSSKWNLNEGWIDTVSHDFAGLLMILMAFGLLLLEFQILKHLVVEVPEEVQPMMVPR